MQTQSQIDIPENTVFYTLAKLIFYLLIVSLPFSLATKNLFGSFLFFTLVFGLPAWIYHYLRLTNISFCINEGNVTIDSGIFTKKSETIGFDSIQSVDIISGPIQSIFGVSSIHIWTSSPSQLSSNSNTLRADADVSLMIRTPDAKWLKDYIYKKTKA